MCKLATFRAIKRNQLLRIRPSDTIGSLRLAMAPHLVSMSPRWHNQSNFVHAILIPLGGDHKMCRLRGSSNAARVEEQTTA
jgi:hypothetical protein